MQKKKKKLVPDSRKNISGFFYNQAEGMANRKG
jgi:hypothetical protein